MVFRRECGALLSKRKRVTRPASLSPLNPVTALGSLLSVALSSVTAKSIYMIPSVAICVNVQPRRCGRSVFSDGGVQFTPTTLFSFKRRRCSTRPLYSELANKIEECQIENHRTYGYRRVHIWLERQGIYHNPKVLTHEKPIFNEVT